MSSFSLKTLLKTSEMKLATRVSRLVSEGNAYNAAGQWSKAVEKYEMALQANPELPAIWVQLGHCRKEQNDTEGAKQAYGKAIELNPSNGDAYFHLAHLLRHQGDVWNGFLNFVSSFEADGHAGAASELALMIGTKTPYDVVKSCLADVFDSETYLRLNPDIRKAGHDPLMHYLLFGWREKRTASQFFDPGYYEDRYEKELEGEIPLVHFAEFGKLGYRGNPVGNQRWFEPVAPDALDWSELKSACRTTSTRAVVIMPVYKGYDETLAAIYHAVSARGDSNYSLLVINDCGPDLKLNQSLETLSRQNLFDYHLNEANKGFVKTVNHAIDHLSGDLDVVLLNSDAYVFPRWFDRLIAHADRDETIATITPLSNNATICSYPRFDHDNSLALEISPSKLDVLAGQINAGISIETPTGVGFCFYMRRSVISELGALDAVAFKLGYGEENDFCMRALNAGYKNVIACDVFAFHVGSVSFSTIKDVNFDAGQKQLNIKHPNYTALVKHHVASDPALFARRRVDLARLAESLSDSIVFVTHKWSGGIDTYLDAKKLEVDKSGKSFITLKVHELHYVSVLTHPDSGIYVPNLTYIDIRSEPKFLALLLKMLKPDLVHVNSFAGLTWAAHAKMLSLIQQSGLTYHYVCHDFSSLTHNYQLVRPDGIYAGVPTLEDLDKWTAMKDSGAVDVCDPVARHEAYDAFFKGAAAIEAPSRSARQIVNSFYPEVHISVVPHQEPAGSLLPVKRRAEDGRLKVAVIGAIGIHKGSEVILGLARYAKSKKLKIDYTIIGYSNQDEALVENGVTITGKYKGNEEAVKALIKLQPDFIFIPSVWPETYCYTLSFALQLKIPPIVFGLGAQGERVSQIEWGTVLDPKLINDPVSLSDELLKLDPALLFSKAQPSY